MREWFPSKLRDRETERVMYIHATEAEVATIVKHSIDRRTNKKKEDNTRRTINTKYEAIENVEFEKEAERERERV